MYRGGGSYHLEIVEAVAGPDGDLAGRVALVQLEIHVQHNKLKPPIQQQINSEEKKDQTPFRQKCNGSSSYSWCSPAAAPSSGTGC